MWQIKVPLDFTKFPDFSPTIFCFPWPQDILPVICYYLNCDFSNKLSNGSSELALIKNKRPDGLTSSFASRNTPWNTPKHIPNKHLKQEGCETSGKYLRKWLNTGIFTYSGAQSGPKTGPLGPIFSTHLKVLAMSMWSNTGVKPVKTFWKNDQRPEFVLLWGPKWSPNCAFKAHIPHTTECTCNEHVKQY